MTPIGFIQVIVNGLLIGGIYALMAVGATLVFGVMRILNFAHGEFIMLGAYATYWLFALYGLDPFSSLFLSMIILALIALVIYKGTLKRILHTPILNQMLLTFGIAISFQSLATILWTSDYRSIKAAYASIPITIGQINFGLVRSCGFLLSILMTLALYYFLKRTETGRSIRAVAMDTEASMLMGVKVEWIRTVAFVISGILGAAAGTILSHIMYIFPLIGFHMILKVAAVIVLGGMGSVPGSIIGALILGLVESLVGTYIPHGAGWAEGVSFVVLIFILIIRPRGIFGEEAYIH